MPSRSPRPGCPCRVFVGERRVLRDRQHRHGDAGRTGEREIALGRQGSGRRDLELSALALGMEQQGFLLGEARALLFLGHGASGGTLDGEERSVGHGLRSLSRNCRGRCFWLRPGRKRVHIRLPSDAHGRQPGAGEQEASNKQNSCHVESTRQTLAATVWAGNEPAAFMNPTRAGRLFMRSRLCSLRAPARCWSRRCRMLKAAEIGLIMPSPASRRRPPPTWTNAIRHG